MKTILLARTFFARFFESDLLPPGVPQAQFTIYVMAGFAVPGLLLPTVFANRYLEAVASLRRGERPTACWSAAAPSGCRPTRTRSGRSTRPSGARQRARRGQ